jgi:hypothetical protein
MRAGSRDLEGKVLGLILRSNRPLAPAEINAAVGRDAQAVRPILKRLVAAGQIEATGATSARRYSKVKQHEFHTEQRTRQETTQQRNAAKIEDGVARVVFRDHVAKAIAADPDSLTIDRLAQALNADPADVTEACAWLVEHNQVLVNDDGTYARNAHGRARLRAAA